MRSKEEYFYAAIANKDIAGVRELLVDPEFNPAFENNNPVVLAATFGLTEIVSLLLTDKRVDPSVNENSAIFYAAHNGNVGMLKVLLADTRVDPNAAKSIRVNRADVILLLLTDSRLQAEKRAELIQDLRLEKIKGIEAISNRFFKNVSPLFEALKQQEEIFKPTSPTY